MTHYRNPRIGRGSAKVAGALSIGVAAAASVLASPPSANATCASFFGIGNGGGCTSSLTSIAIAIGEGATATATGTFSVAIASSLGNAAGTTTTALSDGFGTFAYAGGPSSSTEAHGGLSLAFVQGDRVTGQAFGGLNVVVSLGSQGLTIPPNQTTNHLAAALGVGNFVLDVASGPGVLNSGGARAIGFLSAALNLGGGGNEVIVGRIDNNLEVVPAYLGLGVNLLGTGNTVDVAGFGSTALNIGGDQNLVSARGNLNSAASVLGGTGNIVRAGDYFGGTTTFGNVAFNYFGGGANTVSANPGPFAIAGAIGQNGQNIDRSTPGVTINGIAVPAGATRAKPASAAAAGAHKSSPGTAGTKRAARD